MTDTWRRLAIAGTAFAASFAVVEIVNAQQQVTIASTGGAYDRALKDAWFDPFTKATGIEVRIVSATNAEMRAKAAAMVKSENVSWDLYLEGEIQAASPGHREVTEDLTEFCAAYKSKDGLVSNSCEAGGVLLQSTATLLAFRSDEQSTDAPESWADMWDKDRFPGGRAFPNFDDPWRVLAAALLADGVTKDELFPLDVDRAFRKLDEVRDDVTLWWKTGDQSVQGFRNGDYDLGQIWLTRARSMKDEGLPISWSYKASFLVGDRIALIKGAPNRDNALKLIAYWLDHPSVQAQACNTLSCTPPSTEAIALMSDEARQSMPTESDISEHVIVPDAEWINANAAQLLQRWNGWVR
jgi:mannopine transport system substrate-binding protein